MDQVVVHSGTATELRQEFADNIGIAVEGSNLPITYAVIKACRHCTGRQQFADKISTQARNTPPGV